jgi:hypothetical protein
MGYYLADGTYQCTGGPDSPVSDEDGGIARRAWTGGPACNSPIRFFDFAEEKRVASLQRERDELLAALEAVTEACELADELNWEERGTGPYEAPEALRNAQALIARLEKT